ncbi:MAG: SDR family oxidoreductase [Clostridia bacterium]|nr:SDR family oxidoreductase [Clostridia bacterium]
MKLTGKVAVITGAGAGIGKAIALRFAAEGAKVAVTDINADTAQQVVDEIIAAGGCAKAYLCDVSNQMQVEAVMDAIGAELGDIDILVNNAGGAIVGGKMQRFEDCTREYMDTLIGINLMGTLFCTRAVLPRMIERGCGGRIINLTSIRGVAGDKNNILYGTAKGGVISFTKSLAMAMGKHAITVNAIAPGAIDSRPGPAACTNFLGHPGKCADVAALALLLAGDEGGFMTGDIINIDGGRTLGCKDD